MYGCSGLFVQIGGRRDLDDLAEVHHGDPVGDVTHDREIVRDEQERQVQLVLKLLEQVDDLRLDRDVQRRHRLVAHEELRIEREGARQPDPLALAARELVRIPAGGIAAAGRRPRGARARDRPLSLPDAVPWTRIGSPTIRPIE